MRIAVLVRVIVVLVVVVAIVMVVVVAVMAETEGLRAFYDLFEFATIEPNAAALGAVVDFYPLLVGDH